MFPLRETKITGRDFFFFFFFSKEIPQVPIINIPATSTQPILSAARIELVLLSLHPLDYRLPKVNTRGVIRFQKGSSKKEFKKRVCKQKK